MIWLIGSTGMLGSEIATVLKKNNIDFVGTSSEVDITNFDSLLSFTQAHSIKPSGITSANKFTWIINCAAYTAVDKAEDEAEKAKSVNEIGARNIARVARQTNSKLIHISTDYVFDGSSSTPYTEDSPTCPIGVYATTKTEGEKAVQKEMTQYYILRTSWLYGFNGKNFVYTMTKLMNSKDEIKVVSDQKGTPTNCSTLANTILSIIMGAESAHKLFGHHAALPYGIYHVSDEGETTWYDFATEIYRLGKKYKRISQDCAVNPCTTEEYPTKSKRPMYSVMSKAKIQKELGIKLPNWKESLEKFIKDSRFEVR